SRTKTRQSSAKRPNSGESAALGRPAPSAVASSISGRPQSPETHPIASRAPPHAETSSPREATLPKEGESIVKPVHSPPRRRRLSDPPGGLPWAARAPRRGQSLPNEVPSNHADLCHR